MGIKERLIDPKSPDRRPRRAAYALPTLFTAGNIFLGFVSILRSFRGAMAATTGGLDAPEHFAIAAKAIGAAVFLDGLDGRIARMTNTTSDFGREMDSLADVISFGIAPAVLAYCLGRAVHRRRSLGATFATRLRASAHSRRSCSCSAARRGWRVSTFRRIPCPRIPAGPTGNISSACRFPPAAAMVAGVVFANDGEPLGYWPFSAAWLILLAVLGLLMVSTWRYYSFKGISLSKPYTPLLIILVGAFIYLTWNWPQPVLLAMPAAYVASGILIRLGGIIRRRVRHNPPPPAPAPGAAI